VRRWSSSGCPHVTMRTQGSWSLKQARVSRCFRRTLDLLTRILHLASCILCLASPRRLTASTFADADVVRRRSLGYSRILLQPPVPRVSFAGSRAARDDALHCICCACRAINEGAPPGPACGVLAACPDSLCVIIFAAECGRRAGDWGLCEDTKGFSCLG
jgi:hypothetical protein